MTQRNNPLHNQRSSHINTLKMSAVSPEITIDDHQTCQAPIPPRQMFLYGTLCALPLLAWALTGDSANVEVVRPMCQPGRVHGYARRSLYNKDFPAVIAAINDSVDGYIITFQNTSQWKKLDDFEGELYRPVLVTAEVGSVPGEAQATQTVDLVRYVSLEWGRGGCLYGTLELGDIH